MTFQVWRGWKAYAIKSLLVYSSIFNKENGLLGYNNSTRISATFLMKVLIHIFVKERFTFVIHHLWRWYVEDWCRENRKSFNQACFFFCLLVFSNCNFFLLFSSPYFFLKFWISFCHWISYQRYDPVVTYLIARASFFCCTLCNASNFVKFDYFTIFLFLSFWASLSCVSLFVGSLVPAFINKIPWSKFFSKLK